MKQRNPQLFLPLILKKIQIIKLTAKKYISENLVSLFQRSEHRCRMIHKKKTNSKNIFL